MAQLAIKGHETRGKEVVELLKMLGGKTGSIGSIGGCNIKHLYFIEKGYIGFGTDKSEKIIFTLEEFEEQFPYKVGDKVTYDGDKANIVGMVWDNDINDVFYEIQVCDDVFKCPKELLQPYKEETITIDDFKANTKEWLLDKLQNMSKENTLQTISNLYNELHKPKYPKTYEECCKALGYNQIMPKDHILGYRGTLLSTFQQLLICRDAYWKIAGDWEPNWSEETDKFTISNKCNKIYLNNTAWYSEVLAFPTAEMRDAFYENFKDLITQCKELL